MTCVKAQEFLGRTNIVTIEQIDARKNKMHAANALALAKQVDHIIAAKGSKVVTLDLKKDKPTSEDLLLVLLGPTGNLRAPTFRVGRTLIVGFHEATYRSVFDEPS
jgi:arsenate reductase-like glutaredoxin family protein